MDSESESVNSRFSLPNSITRSLSSSKARSRTYYTPPSRQSIGFDEESVTSNYSRHSTEDHLTHRYNRNILPRVMETRRQRALKSKDNTIKAEMSSKAVRGKNSKSNVQQMDEDLPIDGIPFEVDKLENNNAGKKEDDHKSSSSEEEEEDEEMGEDNESGKKSPNSKELHKLKQKVAELTDDNRRLTKEVMALTKQNRQIKAELGLKKELMKGMQSKSNQRYPKASAGGIQGSSEIESNIGSVENKMKLKKDLSNIESMSITTLMQRAQFLKYKIKASELKYRKGESVEGYGKFREKLIEYITENNDLNAFKQPFKLPASNMELREAGETGAEEVEDKKRKRPNDDSENKDSDEEKKKYKSG